MTDGRPPDGFRSTLVTLLRFWPLAAVAGLLTVAGFAATRSGLRFSRVEQPSDEIPALAEYPTDVPSAPPMERVAPAEPTQLPGWLTTLTAVLCGLVAAVLIGLLVWSLLKGLSGSIRRRRAKTPVRPATAGRSAAQTAAEVVAALDAGLVDLSDTDTDPRRAVIACWVRLEEAAAAAGVPRSVGDTPTDLVTRLLGSASARISADVLATFAHVYRQARYATHTVDEQMRDEARSALARLRAELTAGVPS
ncbi:DUF4129 domain-containing protein [Micromonospora echinofusca]|uniref:DUF4129 domain-containing protein n=1 Tax=Micromonospora echinofusca TaxID=47858 RepID=A0ABS3VVY9_MICEH|nr:DUF4129 domain-containing protein [Micromonospora echinofusca]MBO4208705.1 DUF4129 domain-containing protein [Micromonospora echinofusca]